jgi:hypothetical protein
MQMPDIPIGSRGTFEGAEYICIAYMRRSSDFEGERYTWEEYLLWAQPVGFRWLVKDPETGWSWVTRANPAEIDLSQMPRQVVWGGRVFSLRNQNSARVDYVLGEVYWKCELGETTQVTDFVNGNEVLSREAGDGEANWSYSAPMPWAVIAGGFGLPVGGPGGAGVGGGAPTGGTGPGQTAVLIIIVLVILVICMLGACGSCAGGGGSSGYRGGSGVYSGGK